MPNGLEFFPYLREKPFGQLLFNVGKRYLQVSHGFARGAALYHDTRKHMETYHAIQLVSPQHAQIIGDSRTIEFDGGVLQEFLE
jgi:hypothetical protein